MEVAFCLTHTCTQISGDTRWLTLVMFYSDDYQKPCWGSMT